MNIDYNLAVATGKSGQVEFVADISPNYSEGNGYQIDKIPDGSNLNIPSHSCVIRGDISVFGKYDDDTGGLNAGSFSIYKRNEGIWSLDFTYTHNISSDLVGWSVAIFEKYVVVGASNDISGAGGNFVYIFHPNFEGTWTNITPAGLFATIFDPNDGFGQSVAIYGNYVAVGAFNDDDGGLNAGAVYIFTNYSGVWGPSEAVKLTGTGAGQQFGYGVSLYDDILAVTYTETVTPENRVRIYLRESRDFTGATWNFINEVSVTLSVGSRPLFIDMYKNNIIVWDSDTTEEAVIISNPGGDWKVIGSIQGRVGGLTKGVSKASISEFGIVVGPSSVLALTNPYFVFGLDLNNGWTQRGLFNPDITGNESDVAIDGSTIIACGTNSGAPPNNVFFINSQASMESEMYIQKL